jgi:ribonuclease HII
MTTKRGLSIYRDVSPEIYEIGVDEAGRGPMFGRVYTAAVVLPKENEIFNHEDLRDSKKITSFKKLNKIAEYIKENAISWSVCYKDEKVIDDINIRQATLKGMHDAIDETIARLPNSNNTIHLLVDGNDFKPYMYMRNSMLTQMPHTCYEGGDNKFTAIAAASILAKTERDNYILNLCEEYPILKERYSIDTNKGYGTKKHMDGILQYGITQWHRRSYGICKNY